MPGMANSRRGRVAAIVVGVVLVGVAVVAFSRNDSEPGPPVPVAESGRTAPERPAEERPKPRRRAERRRRRALSAGRSEPKRSATAKRSGAARTNGSSPSRRPAAKQRRRSRPGTNGTPEQRPPRRTPPSGDAAPAGTNGG